MNMDYTEDELESLILGNPLDDSLRIQLENLLQKSEPDCVDVELLRRERQIAEALDRGELVGELILEYKQFRIAQADYFWDMRSYADHLFRPFSLWLVTCNPDRFFSLNLAIQNKLNRTIEPQSLPVEIARGLHPDAAHETMCRIIDFVRRYRGPTGKEPDLMDGEIDIQILATYSSKCPNSERPGGSVTSE